MTTTGTTNFNPALSDLVLEAFARIQMRATSLTPEHTYQAHMSVNLALAEWNIKGGPNLWKVQLLSIPLTQGIASYPVPSNVVAILDYYVRQMQLGNTINYAPNLSTTIGSTSVKVTLSNNGLGAGDWIGFVIPVAIGGLVIFGFYQVTSILDLNNFTITAPNPAGATASNSGAVPQFFTTLGSSSVQVTLNSHALGVGSIFDVQIPTTIGGVTFNGSYTVTSLVDGNNFFITVPETASSTTSGFENNGQTQLQQQLPDVDPIDRVILPISRSEYAQQPDKFVQAFPTSVWFDRLVNPSVFLWPTPDGQGPYLLNYYALVQIQDATLFQGATVDMPVRFLEAFAAELAARLAVKFAPALANDRRLDAERTWQLAAHQDVEEVPLYLICGLSGYFR